jgi:hypothetical protein
VGADLVQDGRKKLTNTGKYKFLKYNFNLNIFDSAFILKTRYRSAFA